LSKSVANDSLRDKLRAIGIGNSSDRFFGSLILLNFFIVFIRPQNDLKFLETIKFPFIFSLLPLAATLLRITGKWSRQLKLMCLIMVQGTLLIPFAVNGFWALQGARALLQFSYGFTFPVAFYFVNRKNLKRLFKAMFLAGTYIAFYCLTHSGHGPGDFLGDENDACLALVILIAPALLFLTSSHSGISKLFLIPTILVCLAGVVAASSRGGFLGLLCVGGYIFYRSRQKFAMMIALISIGLIGLFFVPSSYWEDIGTISTTDSTAQERLTYWGVSWKMFKDPPNFIWGVGMYNFPWRSAEYEAVENKGPHGKSMAGRQVHSLYFEALPEIGLIGCYLLFSAVFACFRPNVLLSKSIRREIKDLKRINASSEPDLAKIIKSTVSDGEFIQIALIAINASFIGMLSGGAFISVLYYPPLWFLLGLSSAAQALSKKWVNLSETIKAKEITTLYIPSA